MDSRIQAPAFVLRMGLGLMATLAGLDKFFNILADWGTYVSPLAVQLLPVSVPTFMGIVGVVEMAVGILILTAWPVIGAYVASAWLLLVAGNLVLGGHLDVAVRDVVLALSAFMLARTMEAGERVGARQPSAARAAGHASA
jgi:hypothetical protein